MMLTQRWRKSSYSAEQTNCVELPNTFNAVRDSKCDAILSLNRHAVIELLNTVKGEHI